MLNVIDTTKEFLPKLINVKIKTEAIQKLVDDIKEEEFQVSEISLSKFNWTKEQLLELTFLFNTINFCFWSGKNEKKWTIEDDSLDGAVALFRCLENEYQRNNDFLSPDELADLSIGNLRRILKGNVTIPLLSERLANMRNFGKVVEQKFDNSITKLFLSCDNDAYKLAEILVDNFDCFDDTSNIDDTEIAFYKRAQLSSKMIHDVLILSGENGLKNLEKLSAFADYKIPQKLHALGILEYSNSLSEKIDDFEILEADSREEVEIRVATIWAVESIKKVLLAKFPYATSSHIDNLLWSRSQTKLKDDKPYHRTLTSAY